MFHMTVSHLLAESLLQTSVGQGVFYAMQQGAKLQKREVDTNFFCSTAIACALMSCQRRILSPTGCSLNEFLVNVGDSGVGKSVVLGAAQSFQRRYLSQTSVRPFSSASAVRKEMGTKGADSKPSRASLVWLDDEIFRFLNAVADGQNQHQRDVFMLLLELWGTPKVLPGQSAVTDVANSESCDDPRFSILSAGIPLPLASCLKIPFVRQSGMLSRLLLVPASQALRFEIGREPILEPVFRDAIYAASQLEWQPEAQDLWLFTRDYYAMAVKDAQHDSSQYHAFVRAAEHVVRIASILAVCHKRFQVTRTDIQAAVEFVAVCIQQFLDVFQLARGNPVDRYERYRRLQLALEATWLKGRNSVQLVRLEDEWVDTLPDQALSRMLLILEDLQIIDLSYKDKKRVFFSPGDHWNANAIDYIISMGVNVCDQRLADD